MAKKRYLSERKLSELIEKVGATVGFTRLAKIMAPYAGFDSRLRYVVYRKALWAALHNAMNLGHPKGPRKPHKWTRGR